MESKNYIEQNNSLSAKGELVVRGMKGRNRLTTEGKHKAKDTWNTVMDSIAAGEMSSTTVAQKAKEFTESLPKNEYNSLLKSSFEARVRNMKRQEYLAEIKASNSAWGEVIDAASTKWAVGKNGEGVVRNYLAVQMVDVQEAINKTIVDAHITDPNIMIDIETRIAKSTLELLQHPTEQSEKAGRNMAELVRLGAAEAANINPTVDLPQACEYVAALSQSEHTQEVSTVPTAEHIVQAVKKSKRQLPEWAKKTGTRARQIGLAVVAAFTFQATSSQPVGSELANYQPDSGHTITVDPGTKPGVTSEITVTATPDKTSEGQEKVEPAPEFGIKGVNGIDLSKPFTMTYKYTEQTIKDTGVESLVVPVDPRAQLGEEMNPDDLRDQGDAKKFPALATVLNTHVEGLNVVEPHSGQLRGWESPFVNKSNGLFTRKSGWMPAEAIRLTRTISDLVGMKVDISQVIDNKVQIETLKVFAAREIPSGYAEVAAGKLPPEGSMLYGYNRGDNKQEKHVSLSLIDVGFTEDEANRSVLAIDTCAGNWQPNVDEYSSARVLLLVPDNENIK